MSDHKPRIVVADDDQGVLEHYRMIFGVEEDEPDDHLDPDLAILDDLIGDLMIEDEPLAEAGWEATLVSQGVDAVHAAQQAIQEGAAFTHAFLDMRMPPGMNGLQTAIQLREIDAEIQIIFVSAYYDYLEDELTQALGERWLFLQKPFQRAAILRMLDQSPYSAGDS
ncbi:MAG: response regulator [Gammaproteobacteria bacterium]|jgi:CheY-like chemotaxis protein|nr:response regulator [Gammaproteobacteria bacterium]